MQKYVASNAAKVTNAGSHARNSDSRTKNSKTNQAAASPIKIQVTGKAYEPPARKSDMAIAVRIARTSATVAAGADRGIPCSASPAQIARTKWKNGIHRKLQRKRPAVGIMHSKSTTKSKTSSHLICFTS